MYLSLICGLFLATVVFAVPLSNTPGIDLDQFDLKGDILVLKPEAARKRNLVVKPHKIWEHGIVPFYITPDMEEHRGKIYEAFNHISNRTCIRFREKHDQDREYIYIFDGGACFSYVGRLGYHVPVSLGPGCEQLVPASHEILHSLGVYHEQSRSDRDDHITVHYENMAPGAEYNFEKLPEHLNQLLVPFDFDSIMLYGPYMASHNGQAVMTAKDPNQKFIDTYEKTGLSELDIKALNKLYKCEKYGPQFAYDD